MADSPYKVYLTEKIDELAKSLFAKRKLEKGTEAETLTKTLQDVGEIMFGKTGMAVDYLNTFLAGKAPETTFKLLDLFAANPTVKDRVMAEITRRVFGVRTKYEKRATLREGKNWLSGLDPCITVYQPNYDDVQWWGALGTFKISIAHPVQDEKSGKVGVMIYGEDEYKWAPDEKRPSQANPQDGGPTGDSGRRGEAISNPHCAGPDDLQPGGQIAGAEHHDQQVGRSRLRRNRVHIRSGWSRNHDPVSALSEKRPAIQLPDASLRCPKPKACPRMTTAYDQVLYPSAIFARTHPDRLAAIARLAGLDPVPPSRARVLEIGGGTCLNLLAIAAEYPGCRAEGFDLSEVAIGLGQDLAEAAGLDNVVLAVDDIMTAHQTYPAKSFDYVIMHGVYAWVPDVVRAAAMALVGHVLSDRGVAFVSYNCMPGGHIRLIMREMLLNVVGHIADPERKLATARAFLEHYLRDQPGHEAVKPALRDQAEMLLGNPDGLLFHDELGDCYYPQRLDHVVAAAQEAGLRHLTDAGRNRLFDGFLGQGQDDGGDPDATVLRDAVGDDYAEIRFFRQTLFVRDSHVLDRRIDPARVAGLYLASRLTRGADGAIMSGEDVITFPDDDFAKALIALAEQGARRMRVSEIAQTEEQVDIIVQLAARWYVTLWLEPAPFVLVPGPMPLCSPLLRAQLAAGERRVCTLAHTMLHIDQPELRALLMAADGTRSLAQIAGMDHGIPPDEVEMALTASAQRGLLRA